MLSGVLIFGVGGVYVLRRLRGVSPARGDSLLTLRQTLRLLVC